MYGNTKGEFVKRKLVVMGIYEVERIVAKRKRGGKVEYFIQWKNYSTAENSWEPAEHLAEDLVAAFEKRSVDPVRADECRERLTLLFEKGLKASLACNETINMRHDVLRALFPEMPSELRGAPYLASKEELVRAGFGSYLKKCLTVTNLPPALGKSSRICRIILGDAHLEYYASVLVGLSSGLSNKLEFTNQFADSEDEVISSAAIRT